MDFKQFEAYVRVIECSSFSKAADTIYLSQPSVSAYVSALEKELGTQLIIRSTKEIFPTKSGKMFYEYAKNILTLRDRAVFTIKNLDGLTSGEIEILASSVPSQYILPELLSKFHEKYRNITFKVIQSDSAEVVNGVISQKSEFGIVGAKASDSLKCIYRNFASDKLVLIAPPIKKFKNLTEKKPLKDLISDEYFIIRENGSGTRLSYESFLLDNGIKLEDLHICASFTNTQSIIHAVSKGLGLSIVSEFAARSYMKQKLVIPIDIGVEMPVRDFYFVFRKGVVISSMAEIFIDFAINYVNESKEYYNTPQ